MGSIYTIEVPSGHRLKIEADTPDEALKAANGWQAQNPTGSDIAYDVAASGTAGVGQGVANTFGALGDVRDAFPTLGSETARRVGGAVASAAFPTFAAATRLAPTSDQIKRGIESVTGSFHEPTTTAGRYAHSVGEAIPGAMLGPEGLGLKLAMGAGAGIGSRFMSDQFAGTPYQTAASIAGGVLGGGGIMGANKGIEAARNYVAAGDIGRTIGNITGTGGVNAGAVRRAAQSAADDNLTPAGVAARQAQLGPESMVMDMGRQMQGRAEAIALPPGRAQNTVLDAVESRTGEYGAGARQRIGATLDQELGPSRNVVDLKNEMHRIIDNYAAPAYREVMDKHPVVWDETLQTLSQRPAIAEAMNRARGVAANYGEVIEGAQPSLKYWDYVKKSLDQRINGMMRSGMDDLSSAQKADLGGLMNARNALRSHLDNVTGGEYANARRISATKPELDEAFDFGRSLYNSKLLPEEVAAQLGEMSIPAQQMAQAGARRELERVLDSTRNDGAKARSFLDTNNNSEKIRLLFGDQASAAIANRVGAENTFQDATQTIARNSRTATRQQLIQDTETPSPARMDTTITGLALKGAKAGYAYALQHGMENTRQGIANIVTAKNDRVAPVVEQLLKYNKKKSDNAAPAMSQQANILIRALMGTR